MRIPGSNHILSFLFSFLSVPLFGQTAEWVRTASSGTTSAALEIVADISGSSYVMGTFFQTMSFDTLTLTTGSIQSHYVVKLRSNGSPAWGVKITNTAVGAVVSEGYLSGAPAHNLAITSDQKGGIYVAGQFSNGITVGPRTITQPGNGLFVSKLDTNGNVRWLLTCGNAWARVSGLAADSLGHIYLTGWWENNTPLFFGSTVINFAGNSDGYLAKIRTSDSTFVWAKGIAQTNQYEQMTSVAADKVGNVYVTGIAAGSINWDAYLTKLDSNGTRLWQHWLGCTGSTSTDEGQSVIVDPENNVYVSGTVNGASNITFDTISIAAQAGQIKRFISKFTPSGRVIWLWLENTVMSSGHPRDCYLTNDINGNIYCGGSFRDSLNLGPLKVIGPYNLVTAYLAGLSSAKPFKWAKQNTVSGTRRAQIYALSATPFGDIYACGAFDDSVKFDSLIGRGIAVDAFVVKIASPWIFTGAIGGSPFCSGFPIEVPFTTKGDFPENTIYYLQLSDSSGSFANALTLDSMVGKSLPLFLSRIPIDMPSGTKYRLRVISKNPLVNGSDNGVNLRIIAAPKITFDPPSPIRVCDLSSPIQVAAAASGATVFNWRDGIIGATRILDSVGWYYLTVENEYTCERLDSIQVIDLPPVEAQITPSRELPMCEGSNVDLVASGGVRYSWSTGDTAQTINVESPGLYTVIAYDIAGCLDSTSIQVTTKPGPSISISLQELFYLCPGDSVLITATEAPNYLWSTGDTTRSIMVKAPGMYYVSTADSNCRGYSKTLVIEFYQTVKPTISRSGDTLKTNIAPPVQWYFNGVEITGETAQTLVVVATGVYTVQKVDSNGCKAISNGFPVTVGSVVEDLVAHIRIQPNPVRDRLTISLPEGGIYTVAIYDVLGKHIITSFNGYSSASPLDVELPSSVASGSYMLRVTLNGSTRSFKFIRE